MSNDFYENVNYPFKVGMDISTFFIKSVRLTHRELKAEVSGDLILLVSSLGTTGRRSVSTPAGNT
jgi:hypothetical protein